MTRAPTPLFFGTISFIFMQFSTTKILQIKRFSAVTCGIDLPPMGNPGSATDLVSKLGYQPFSAEQCCIHTESLHGPPDLVAPRLFDVSVARLKCELVRLGVSIPQLKLTVVI